jgi:hypothetical protein
MWLIVIVVVVVYGFLVAMEIPPVFAPLGGALGYFLVRSSRREGEGIFNRPSRPITRTSLTRPEHPLWDRSLDG